MFSCLHTVLSYLVSELGMKMINKGHCKRGIHPCAAFLTCAHTKPGGPVDGAASAQVLSHLQVEPSDSAFTGSGQGQKKPTGAWAEQRGALVEVFIFHRHEGSALNHMCKPSLREHCENLGRVSCWHWESYLRKCVLPSIWVWEEVPVASAKHPLSWTRWLGCVSCDWYRRMWSCRIYFCLGFSENVFQHTA